MKKVVYLFWEGKMPMNLTSMVSVLLSKLTWPRNTTWPQCKQVNIWCLFKYCFSTRSIWLIYAAILDTDDEIENAFYDSTLTIKVFHETINSLATSTPESVTINISGKVSSANRGLETAMATDFSLDCVENNLTVTKTLFQPNKKQPGNTQYENTGMFWITCWQWSKTKWMWGSSGPY